MLRNCSHFVFNAKIWFLSIFLNILVTLSPLERGTCTSNVLQRDSKKKKKWVNPLLQPLHKISFYERNTKQKERRNSLEEVKHLFITSVINYKEHKVNRK